MEASEGQTEHQITTHAHKTLIALQKCLQVAGRHAQLVEAQVARFNLWATNIGVFAKYKASLDFRLRDSPDVQRIIINLLDILGIYAGQAIRIESVSFEQDGVTIPSSLSAAGRQTEVFGGDAQQAFQVRPLKDLSIIPAYQAVDDTISRLHRLSTAIRNAGMRNPYSRIARLTVVDEDGNDINYLFESFIARVLEVRFSCLSARLRRRIGDAICFRRRRFIYNRPSGQRNGHQFVPLAFPDEPKASHLLAPLASQKRMTGALGPVIPQAFTSRTASTFHPHRFQNPRPSEPSVASTATASSYVPRMDESIPKAPSVESGQKEAQCSFCPFVVSIKDLNGIRWIKHFLNDLEPYVCLFEDCMSPHQLFSSVEQWLDHMKSHPAPSTEWICNMRHSAPTETVMKSAEDFTAHMKDAHPDRFTDIQIKSLVVRAARPSPMFPNCLLCGWSVPPDAKSEGRVSGSLTSMEEHIADHLVDLALLSLPPRQGTERDDEVSMKTSGNASLNSGKRLSHSALSHDLSGFDLQNDQELLPDEERTSGMNQERDGPVPSFPSAGPEFRSPHHPDEEGQASANLPLQEQGRDRRSLPSQITVPELSIVPELVPTQSPDSSIPPPPPHDALTQMGDQLPPQRSIFTCSWENCSYSSETGTLEDFLRHVERVHTSSSGYVCPVAAGCGLSYSRISALSEHKIGHYDSVPSLETSSVARQNERSTTDSPILCKWHGCLRTEHFLSSVDLLEHITAVHIGSRDLIGTRNDLDETTNSQDTPRVPQSSLISHAPGTTSPSTPTPAGPPPPSHTPTYSSHLAFGATQTQYPAPHLPRTQPDTTPTNVYSPRPSISHARNPSVGTEYDGASNGYSYPQPRVQNERSAYPKTALPPLRLELPPRREPPKLLNMQRSSETLPSDPIAYQIMIQPPAPRSQTPLAPSLPPLRSLSGDISNNLPQPQNGMVQSPGLDLTGGKKLLWETYHSVSKRSYGDTFGHDEGPLFNGMRPDPENYAAFKPPSDIKRFVIPASEAPAQDLLPALHSPDNNHTLPSLQTALGLSSVPMKPGRPKGSSPLSLPPVTAASPPSLRSESVWEQPRTAPFCAQVPPPSPYSHWSPASTTVGNVSAVSSPASQNSHWRSLKSEISNGIQWLAFESVQDRVRMEYTIRCDIKSVNVDSLSQEFKTENCVYPRAYCSKNQYRGNLWEYETESNAVGWALAELNPTLRGKRGLIQRAVDSWRNSIQNPLLRSRRVQRIPKTNRARDPFSPG